MQVIEKTKKDKAPGKILKILLFWSTFFFIIFLGKRMIGYPKGNIDFVVKNLMSFGCAIILSGVMLRFFNVKSLKLSIPIIWFLIILLIII